ncbi:MAG: 4-hydroxy-tetrahydrodipicolinate synthase [Rhodospirillales bacterium]
MFRGSMPALITPFTDDDRFDESAFRAFVSWQIEEGSHGLVPCGTTGESPTLNHDEHMRVIETCIDAAAGRVPVIAGTGSNSTAEAVMLTEHAHKAGADAALVVTPYYNKPTQAGLYAHYKAVHDAADIPVLIYNIPGRSAVDMTVETMARLAELPNIVGVKDATADLARPALTALACGEDFCMLSGEDATAAPLLAGGGHGCISVTANIAPRLCAEVQNAWIARDIDAMLKIQARLMPVHSAMFCETSPGPVKYAAHLLGKCSAKTRPPIIEIADDSKQQVSAALRGAGLLN